MNKRLLIIITCFVIINGCCNHHYRFTIKDKSWFPYSSKSGFLYKSSSGLNDSLNIVQLDTGFREIGVECIDYEEYRNARFQSNLYPSLQYDITLTDKMFEFSINLFDKRNEFYYCDDCNKPYYNPHKAFYSDSIDIDGNLFKDVLILVDSAKNFEINYSKLGIIRYIIRKDTFNLK